MKRIVQGKEVHRRVIRQGNSLMVTIPPDVLEKLRIREGDPVTIVSDGESVTYRKFRG